jgi:hypothetical protein
MTPGTESDWIELTTLVSTGELAIADLVFIGDSQMPRLFKVKPGRYLISIKLASLANGQKRVARMRALNGKQAKVGRRLDGLPVDMWRVGFYDPTVTIIADDQREAVDRKLRRTEMFGVVTIPSKPPSMLGVVFSGMGAGYYPIHALTRDKRRVGLEVIFIGPEELAEHPDQMIVRPKSN